MTPETATILAAIIGFVAVIVGVLVQTWLASRQARAQALVEKQRAASQKEKRLEVIMENKVLRCGCVKHPPLSDFEYKGNVLTFSGLYVEIAKEVCLNNSLTPVFLPVDWTDISSAFDDNTLDLVLSVFETNQRLGWGDFTACFHKLAITGVTKAVGSKVEHLDDLYKEEVRIVVTKGEAGWEFITRDLKLPKHRLIVMENSNLTEMMDYVLTGKVDVAICDELSCDEFVSKNPSATCVFKEDNLYLCKNCIMVPKSEPKLREWISREFAQARTSPRIKAIEEPIINDPRKIIRRFS